MSILSSSKTSWMFFNLHLKKDTSRFSAYKNYYCHNIDHSFEPIFFKFAWLVRVSTCANLIVFENNQSNRTTDMEGNVHPKLVFWLSFSRYGNF